MLIFKTNDVHYCFIHIPKNSGKYIRQKIKDNKNNEILFEYCNIKLRLDLFHIPYMKKNDFIQNDIDYTYLANTRNPYDRIISAFLYLNPLQTTDDFKDFVKNTLILFDFNMSFDFTYIHYYPQYLFVCDENLDIPKNIKIDKLEEVEHPRRYNLTTYLDDECLRIINTIYRKDFLFFNYPTIDHISKCCLMPLPWCPRNFSKKILRTNKK